jgi:secondary thiamine-phosphate synthase enzyme
MARLDRLGSAKEVAQIGAVIGREFSHALIAAVARKGEPELRSALDRLIDAGLLFRQGVAPHATYLFKHALVQDAAYGTLLREPRRALHARIAETLDIQFADIAENQPELLARHATEAGQIEPMYHRLTGNSSSPCVASSPCGVCIVARCVFPQWGMRSWALKEELGFEGHTKKHRAYVHITPQVEEILRKSGVKEGMVLVSAMHITAGVYVNDNESGLIEDIDQWLEHLAPFRKDYKHHETGENNGDSHLKALLIHHEVIVPVTSGKLDLGTWQRIFYAEFDGQRDKRVIVKVMGE